MHPLNRRLAFAVVTVSLAWAAPIAQARAQDTLVVASPDGRNRVSMAVHDGQLYYMLTRDSRPLLLPSMLGFEFKGAPPLKDGLRIRLDARHTRRDLDPAVGRSCSGARSPQRAPGRRN
jgi:hypothetical protein